MAYYCQACGKEMDREEEFCEECKASMSILDGEPATPTAAPAPTPTAPLMNEPKKGNGPAIAALILSIIGFVTTIFMCAIFSTAVRIPGFLDELSNTMREIYLEFYNISMPQEILIPAFKYAFAVYYFSGALFMILGLIFGIVAVVKYANNTCPFKSKAVLVMGIIALVFVVISLIIAIVSSISTSNFIDSYYGIM